MGDLNLRAQLNNFLGLKSFIFCYVWIFLFGVKNENWNYGKALDIIPNCLIRTSQVKDTLKAFDDFKNKQKSVYEVTFFSMRKYLYSEILFNTLYNEIKHKWEKIFPSDKINGTKMPSFLFASSNSGQFYF